MDDTVSELRQLRPARPDPRLERRIEEALGPEPGPSPRRLWPVLWLRWTVGTAAATALLFLIVLTQPWLPRPGTAPSPGNGAPTVAQVPTEQAPLPSLSEIHSGNYLFHAQEDGVVYASSTLPLRKIKYQFLDTSDWKDEENNLTVQVIRPREEIMLVPIRIY